jgi:integrase
LNKQANGPATIPLIGSTARIGESVARRRFQKGSVFLNKPKTQWLGMYCEYILDQHGVEKRLRKQIVLCPVKLGDKITRKRDAQRLLQPYLDRVNSSLATPARAHKTATFDAFATVWDRDYLSLTKASTQSGMRTYLNRLRAAFGKKDMRQIDAGDIQRLISSCTAEGLAAKTIRNLWGTVRLIWDAALAQKYVDALLPKPKLPRRQKKKARYFTMTDVARMIAASTGEQRVFYWLASETGLRSGELAGLKLADIDGERLSVSRSIWGGKEQHPKTDNAVRTLALSPQLISLLWEQIARQTAKGHDYLFSSVNGTAWDMDVFRQRKLKKLLSVLGIGQAGFHAFRHFNVSLLDALRVPLKAIQERAGHALTGSFTLDVYGHAPEWELNLEAARSAGAAIETAVRKIETEESNYSVSLTAIKQEQLPVRNLEAVENV